MRKIFEAFFFLFLAQVAIAQEQVNFKLEVSRIDSLIRAGDFSNADTLLLTLQESLQNTSLIEEDTVRLFFSSKLAFVKYQLGNCEETISYSKNDISNKLDVYGEADAVTLSAMRNLGVYYLNCDSINEARTTLEETLDIHKRLVGKVDEIFVKTLDDLAFTYSKLDEKELTRSSYDQLIELLIASGGSFYIHVIENYSAYLMSIEEYENAAIYFETLKEPMKVKEEFPIFLRDYYNVFVHLKDYVRALETASLINEICGNSDCQTYEIDKKQFNLSSARLALLLSRFDEAKGYYNQAEVDFASDPSQYITILSEEAELYDQSGDKKLQISKLNISLDLHRKYNYTDSSSYTRTVLQLGQLYSELGQFKESDELFNKYISELEASNEADPLQLASAYQSLGNQRFFLQNFKDADLYFVKARNLLNEQGLRETNEFASILNSQGALYEGLVNYPSAERNYREALSLISDEVSSLRISLASNLANILTITEPDNDSISVLLNRAIEWQLEFTGENHPAYANMLSSRGVYYLNNGSYDLAESDLTKAVETFRQTVGEAHPQYLSSLSNLGLLYQNQNKNGDAEKMYVEARVLYEQNYSATHPGAILTLNNLANLYTSIEKYEEAEPLLMELASIQVKEINESFSYLSESEKKNFVKEKRKLLDNFKGYVVARSINDEGSIRPEVITKWYDLELSTKGMLLNATKKIRNSIYSSGDEELIALFASWTAARKQIADFNSLKNRQEYKGDLLDSLIGQTNALEKEIARKSVAFSGGFTGEAPSFERISQSLEPNEASIEIIRTQIGGEAIYVALIGTADAANPSLFIIGKGADLEQSAFRGYKNTIKYKIDDAKAFESYWRTIHTFLTSKGVTKVYYAPDGVYHKISLSTLYNPDEKNYLLEELEIIQVTSTKDLLSIKKQSKTDLSNLSEVLLVGRPSYSIGTEPVLSSTNTTRGIGMGVISDLPGTEEEVSEIGSVFQKNGVTCEVRLGDNAKEREVKKLLNSQMVHIATHGFFNESGDGGNPNFDPMTNAGLLLAGVSNESGVSGEDGILTAYEIMNMELSNIQMIVLSACETGLGEVSSGEGIYGLQRAFFVGGAETLVMSLWKVDDEATKELMTSFYKEFIKTGDKREAFTNAQLKIKKKYKSPIYWGAFVMLEG